MPQRDPNLDHAAVKLYREIVHLNLNHIQRRDVAVTVHEPELELWKAVLIQFMREGRDPRRIDWLMDRFESALRRPKWNGST